jgi:hypothetical protein
MVVCDHVRMRMRFICILNHIYCFVFRSA